MDYFILVDGQPVPTTDVNRWAKFMEDSRANDGKRVDRTTLEIAGETVDVSTVFLGMNHSFDNTAEPVLYETIIFGGPQSDWQRRYCTLAEAQAGHAHAVKVAKGEADADD